MNLMLNTLFHMSAVAGPSAAWTAKFCAAVVATFVLYIGIALRATLRATDPEQRKMRYQIFRDLLDLFRRGWDR
jgi:hypothetical protein